MPSIDTFRTGVRFPPPPPKFPYPQRAVKLSQAIYIFMEETRFMNLTDQQIKDLLNDYIQSGLAAEEEFNILIEQKFFFLKNNLRVCLQMKKQKVPINFFYQFLLDATKN